VKKILLLLDNNRRIFKTAPLGLFDIVADKSSGGMGGDDKKKMTKTMYDAIIKEHEVKNAKIFLKIRASNKFTIFHSAKNVVYDATNFIERNADSMSSSLSELIMTKSVPMVGKIYSMKTGFEA
jgi:myosin heavy subunit